MSSKLTGAEALLRIVYNSLKAGDTPNDDEAWLMLELSLLLHDLKLIRERDGELDKFFVIPETLEIH